MPPNEFRTHRSLVDTFQPFIDKEGGINKGCKSISKKLKRKWTWKYLYHVYRGSVTPGRELARKLKALRPPPPPSQRHRKIIEATSENQLKQWNTLTSNELRNALDKEVEKSNGKQTKIEPEAMQKQKTV